MNKVTVNQLATAYTAAWNSQVPASVAVFFAEGATLSVNEVATLHMGPEFIFTLFARTDGDLKYTYEQVRTVGYFYRDLRRWAGCNFQQ